MRSLWKGLFILNSLLKPNNKKQTTNRLNYFLSGKIVNKNYTIPDQIKKKLVIPPLLTFIDVNKIKLQLQVSKLTQDKKRSYEGKRLKRRNLTILPKYLGYYFQVYNGRTRGRRKYITKLMIKGRRKKLGEFAATRKI